MLRFAICDPDIEFKNLISDYIADDTDIDDDYSIDYFPDITHVERAVKRNDFCYDILLLYVAKDDSGSMALADIIRSSKTNTDIWFFAENEEQIKMAFQYRPFNFSIKPVSYSYFCFEMRRFILINKKVGSDLFSVRVQGKELLISLHEVLFFSSSGRKIAAQMQNGKEEIWFYSKLDDLEKKLAKAGFLRIHQSYLINENCIESIDGEKVTTGMGSFPVSRKYMDQVSKRWEIIKSKYHVLVDGSEKKETFHNEKTMLQTQNINSFGSEYGLIFGLEEGGVKKYRLYDMERIKIGRNPYVCQIYISDNKVSRIHCEVSFNESKQCFLVKDLSNNGTFVDGMGRLLKNVEIELKRETMIKICNRDHSFWLI